MTNKISRPKPWMLKKEIIVLYYGLNDRRTGWTAKIPAICAVLYLLSPIDFIPDFIPFLGYLDDVIIVPLLLNLSVRLLPEAVREESLQKANRQKKKLIWSLIVGIILLIAGLVAIGYRTGCFSNTKGKKMYGSLHINNPNFKG